MPDPQYVSTTEAAEMLDCSVATINRKAANGQLPPVSSTAAFRMFHRSDVERLVEAERAKAAAKLEALAAISASPGGEA